LYLFQVKLPEESKGKDDKDGDGFWHHGHAAHSASTAGKKVDSSSTASGL